MLAGVTLRGREPTWWHAQQAQNPQENLSLWAAGVTQLEEDGSGAEQAMTAMLRQLHAKLCEVQQSQQRLESR